MGCGKYVYETIERDGDKTGRRAILTDQILESQTVTQGTHVEVLRSTVRTSAVVCNLLPVVVQGSPVCTRMLAISGLSAAMFPYVAVPLSHLPAYPVVLNGSDVVSNLNSAD